MQRTQLGNAFETSALTLGGGGIGQVWGRTNREEAIATVRAAYDAGITLFDMAPLYGDGEAERVMALVFGEGYPSDVRLTTKCMLGPLAPTEIETRLRTSLAESAARLQRDFIDVFILHGYVIPDGWSSAVRPQLLPHIAIEYSTYREFVTPVFEALIAEGKIGAFGVTAASTQATNLAVIETSPAPALVQCISNVLDAPGGMAISEEAPDPRAVIESASAKGVGVMGIRAVAAGALTSAIDRDVKPTSAEARDFERAAGFRAIASDFGLSPAALAHRYALSMPGVDTVVLGVKNREELDSCVKAEALPRLSVEEMNQIDLGVRGSHE